MVRQKCCLIWAINTGIHIFFISIEVCSRANCHWLRNTLNGPLRKIIPLFYHSSLLKVLPDWSWRRCKHVTSSSNKCTIESRDTTGKLRTLMSFVLEEIFGVIYPTVVTATMFRQREMFSQMTLAYVRFVTWDWHIQLIMFWKAIVDSVG